MRPCLEHPEEEALLSCSVCGQPLCGICARNTSVGTRCPACAGERPVAPPLGGPAPSAAAAARDTRRPYHIALACAVLIVLLTQGSAIPIALPAAAVCAWSWGLAVRKRFLLGTGAFIVVWTIAVSLLLRVSEGGTLTGTLEHVQSPATALGLIAALGICVWLLWGPSSAAARELLARGRPIAAAFVISAGGGAAILSIMLSILIAVAI